eukprot:4382391-Amphidinium_carterae.1
MCEMWPTVLKDQEFPGVPDPDPAGDGCLFKYPLPVESLIKLGARVLVLLPNLTEQVDGFVFNQEVQTTVVPPMSSKLLC